MDKIQKVLVEQGRKDLAQEYYKKVATIAEDDSKAAIQIKSVLESTFKDIQDRVTLIKKNLSSFNSPGLTAAFVDAIRTGLSKGAFDASNAQVIFDRYYAQRGPMIQRENYNNALKAIQAAQIDEKIDLTKFRHKYWKNVKFTFDKDVSTPYYKNDDGYTWDAEGSSSGRTTFPTKGTYVLFWATLDGAKKNFIAKSIHEDDFETSI